MALKCRILASAVLACIVLTEALPASQNMYHLHHRFQKRNLHLQEDLKTHVKDHSKQIAERQENLLCGKMLSDTLALVCNNVYHSPTKRNSYIDVDDKYLEWDSSFPRISEPGTTDFNSMNQFTRSQRGIVDECCRNKCSLKQLYSYCG